MFSLAWVRGKLVTVFVWAHLSTFQLFYSQQVINQNQESWGLQETCLGLASLSVYSLPAHPKAPSVPALCLCRHCALCSSFTGASILSVITRWPLRTQHCSRC